MTTRFNKDSTTTIAVAGLIDTNASNGTANALNEMARAGVIKDGMTIGEIAFHFIQRQQEKLYRLAMEVDQSEDEGWSEWHDRPEHDGIRGNA